MTHFPEIGAIDDTCWKTLSEAASNSDHPLRYLTFCTVDPQDHPQARTLVLRYADRDRRVLEFHTDVRSPKWRELAENPKATVLGFDQSERTQIRMTGEAAVFGPGDPMNTGAWNALSPWTKTTYQGGPPGDYTNQLPIDTPHAESGDPEPAQDGASRFGIILFRAFTLDWCLLARSGNRRAIINYAPDFNILNAEWVNP